MHRRGNIAVASGKGGTGKTTVAVSLAISLQRYGAVCLVDCDVEEPNAHLLLEAEFDQEIAAEVASVAIDIQACTGCRACANACRFNAIAVIQSGAMFFPELCHGCMGCVLACPNKCVSEVARRTGTIRIARQGDLRLVSGELDVGQAMATGVINAARRQTQSSEVTVLDSPPGTNCAMLAAVADCDQVVLVAEPTPFGLNDLKLAVDALRQRSLRFSVAVNRCVHGEDSIDEYCQDQGIEVFARIPDSLEVARLYSQGVVPYGRVEEFTVPIDQLAAKLMAAECEA